MMVDFWLWKGGFADGIIVIFSKVFVDKGKKRIIFSYVSLKEMFVVRKSAMLFNEYENGYDGDYGGAYDQNFVFYDEDELEEEIYEDDFVLEEIPFVYCPSRGELFEA